MIICVDTGGTFTDFIYKDGDSGKSRNNEQCCHRRDR